jgi:HAMP domain-containing protein
MQPAQGDRPHAAEFGYLVDLGGQLQLAAKVTQARHEIGALERAIRELRDTIFDSNL